MSFQEFCSELQRRLPLPISGCRYHGQAVVSLNSDPEGVTWACPLDLASLVQAEIYLSVRMQVLRQVTVH